MTSTDFLTAGISTLEAVLFDLDGTLIDTDDMVVERLARRFKPFFGRRASPVARWLLMRAETPGTALVSALDSVGLDEQFMTLTDRLRRRRGVYPAGEFRLISGVAEMIPILSQKYKLGLVTIRSRYHIERFFEQFPAIAAEIQTTIGLQDTRRLKPDPSPVLLAADRLDVPVSNCLMVGDTAVDIKAGRRAGAWTAGVLCGFGRRHELERNGADLILESTSDLLDWL